jgi:heptose I phosphotransferase
MTVMRMAFGHATAVWRALHERAECWEIANCPGYGHNGTMPLFAESFILNPDWRSQAAAMQLDSLDRCLTYAGGVVVKDARKNRDVLRIEAPCGAVFLKRIRGAGWREIPHESRILHHLRSHGLPVPEPIAVGARRGAAVLLTKALPETQTLEHLLLTDALGGAERRSVMLRLSAVMRHMHDVGVNHRDFYAGHVHVSPSLEIYLVDLGRAELRNTVPYRRAIKDLAALHMSIPGRCASAWLRLRFLASYLGAGTSRQELLSFARATSRKSVRMLRHGERKLRRGDGNIHINR